MCTRDAASFTVKIGMLFSLLLAVLFVSDAAAQCHKGQHHSRQQTVNNEQAYRPPASYQTEARYSEVSQTQRRYDQSGYQENGRIHYDSDFLDTERVAGDYGYRDGWKKGEAAAMERKSPWPEKHGLYQSGTNGYKARFGSKDVYRHAYQAAFIKGYRAGYRSIASRRSY